jgi:hypothetical protein
MSYEMAEALARLSGGELARATEPESGSKICGEDKLLNSNLLLLKSGAVEALSALNP